MSENNPPQEGKKTPSKNVSVIHRINYLREKAGGSRHGSGSGKLDERVIAKAQNAVNNYAPAYPAMVNRDLDGLIAQMTLLEQAATADQKPILRSISAQANEVQSLGATFGYLLISVIGRSLRGFADALDEANPNHIILMRAHVDTLRVVLARKIKGLGGIEGKALLTELKRVLDKNGGHESAQIINDALSRIEEG